MRVVEIFFTIGIALASTAPSIAGPRCNVALTDWKPRQELEAKLKSEGWTLHRIKTDDGCYKVYGLRGDGQRVKATFTPDTLMLIREKNHDD